MKCPYCANTKTHVLESRSSDDGTEIRRRRECEGCEKRFTTQERIKDISLWVIKKDGRREPFEKDKIRKGISRALEKRPVPAGKIEEITKLVERKMLSRQQQEITAKEIGDEVLKHLRKTDKVAWLRFASVYLEFDNLKDFDKAMKH